MCTVVGHVVFAGSEICTVRLVCEDRASETVKWSKRVARVEMVGAEKGEPSHLEGW